MSGQDVPLDEGDDEPSPECPRTDNSDCRTLVAPLIKPKCMIIFNILCYTMYVITQESKHKFTQRLV